MFGKRSRASLAFFVACIGMGALAITPVLFLFPEVLAAFSAPIWGLLILTGAFQAIYYLGLGRASQEGEISITYPLARSLPVILVALFTLLAGGRFSLLVWPRGMPSFWAL